MKKAKLMLTSLAVFAIVGSALAYKVSNDRVYIDTNGDSIADTFITGWKLTTQTVDVEVTFGTTTINVPVVQTVMLFTGN